MMPSGVPEKSVTSQPSGSWARISPSRKSKTVVSQVPAYSPAVVEVNAQAAVLLPDQQGLSEAALSRAAEFELFHCPSSALDAAGH